MTTITGKVCAITGAGSGIGRALALELAGRGAILALSDVNESGLQETAELARSRHGATVSTHVVDVSDSGAVEQWAGDVVAEHGRCNQIYNNAGIAFQRSIIDSSYEDWRKVFSINLFGVIHGTKAFLPHVIASGDGHVTNISSLNGLMAQPDMSHYVTAKFGVRGFTETLRTELLMAGHPVKTTVVHPGGVKTNIATAAAEVEKARGADAHPEVDERTAFYNKMLLRLSAEDAAKIIVDGVVTGSPRVVVGRDAKFLDLLIRVAPKAYPKAVVRGNRRMIAWVQKSQAKKGQKQKVAA